MGFRCTWIATRGSAAAVVLAALDLERTESLSEPAYDPGLFGLDLPGGWFLVFADGWDYMDLLGEGHAAGLSSSAESWFFQTDDTSMCTWLSAYAKGKRAWLLTYDGSNGIGNLTIDGTPPASVADELARATAQQRAVGDASVDYVYDVTAAVADELLGFRHDRTLAEGEIMPIQVLAPRARR